MGSIYTKSGDDGFCDIVGKRLPKSDLVIELLGDLDELNSFLGLAKAHQTDEELKNEIEKIQMCLIPIMGEIAGGAEAVISVDCLEALCDKYFCEELVRFSVPGKTKASAYLDVARTVARRAERKATVVLKKSATVPWLNRLSDVLFAMARYTE